MSQNISRKRCRGVICIRSCPEAEVEGPEADIADPEDITIIEDPGVDVEGSEANVQSDTCIKISSEGRMPQIYGTGESDSRPRTPDSPRESVKCELVGTSLNSKQTKYLVTYCPNDQESPEDGHEAGG
jgi:hypothetical protein